MKLIDLTLDDINSINEIADMYKNIYKGNNIKNGYTLGNAITDYLGDKYYPQMNLGESIDRLSSNPLNRLEKMDKYLDIDLILNNGEELNRCLMFKGINKWWELNVKYNEEIPTMAE